MTAAILPEAQAPQQPSPSLGATLNRLRAAVLGANDGITSVAGLVLGVAALNPANTPAILTAGLAGLVAGACSMAMGEYVSVSTQRDTERSLVDLVAKDLADDPQRELEQLASLYRQRGLSTATAYTVAAELTAADPLRAHLDAEFGLDPDELTSPTQAAISSFLAFTLGALLPLLCVLIPPPVWRIPVAFVAVALFLAITGWISAKLGKVNTTRAVVRVVAGGALAMVVTYLVGALLGVSGLG